MNSGQNCADVDYQSSDVISFSGQPSGLRDRSIDLTDVINNSGTAASSFGMFCIRNISSEEVTGQLSATLLTRSSSEIGDCDDAEIFAESTPRATDCNDGELDQIVQIIVKEGNQRCRQGVTDPFSATFLPSDAVGTTSDFSSGRLKLRLPDGAE